MDNWVDGYLDKGRHANVCGIVLFESNEFADDCVCISKYGLANHPMVANPRMNGMKDTRIASQQKSRLMTRSHDPKGCEKNLMQVCPRKCWRNLYGRL